MKHTVLRLLGERPTRATSPFHVNSSELDRRGSFVARDLAVIPADWEIWNAPRPLSGHLTWIGDFQHGTLWAAIDPADDEAPLRIASSWRRYNIDMDAFRVLWLPREQALTDFAQKIAAGHQLGTQKEIADSLAAALDPTPRKWAVASWLEDSWQQQHRMEIVDE